MKKYILGLSFISFISCAEITLNTKISLREGDQTIKKNVSFIVEPGKKLERVVGDFEISSLVKLDGEKYRCEFEIYHLDHLICKPVLILNPGIPGEIRVSHHEAEALDKEFIFSVLVK